MKIGINLIPPRQTININKYAAMQYRDNVKRGFREILQYFHVNLSVCFDERSKYWGEHARPSTSIPEASFGGVYIYIKFISVHENQ